MSGPPPGVSSGLPGPPYLPQVWLYGGKPDLLPDVPLCAAYLTAYLAAAVIHKVVFLKNKKKGQKFVMSAMTFGFCFVRLITFSTRLAWGVNPQNAKLSLVSNLFLNAGIPILYIINLVFAHRIIRAQHPRLGWHKSLSIIGKLLIAGIILTLILLIYSGINSAMTLNPEIHHITSDIQKYGATYNNIIAFLPLPMLLIGVIVPRRVRTEKFGQGRFRVKIAVLVVSSTLLTLRATWGTISTYQDPVPVIAPQPWYLTKAAFYTVQLLTELIVVYMFIAVRINRIFYTPDGLPRGSYVTLPKSTDQLHNPPPYGEHSFPTVTTLHVYSEEELFDEERALADTLQYSNTSLLLDNASGKWRLSRHGGADQQGDSGYHGYPSTHRLSSTSSNFFYTPMANEDTRSRTTSQPPSVWNQERYEKPRERRDSTGTTSKSAKSTRRSFPSAVHEKQAEMEKEQHHAHAGRHTPENRRRRSLPAGSPTIPPDQQLSRFYQQPQNPPAQPPMSEVPLPYATSPSHSARVGRLPTRTESGAFQDLVDRVMAQSEALEVPDAHSRSRTSSRPRSRTSSRPQSRNSSRSRVSSRPAGRERSASDFVAEERRGSWDSWRGVTPPPPGQAIAMRGVSGPVASSAPMVSGGNRSGSQTDLRQPRLPTQARSPPLRSPTVTDDGFGGVLFHRV